MFPLSDDSNDVVLLDNNADGFILDNNADSFMLIQTVPVPPFSVLALLPCKQSLLVPAMGAQLFGLHSCIS